MLPQINPFYFQQQPAYQMPQMTNYPQNTAQVQLSTISGRLIDNINQVTANDVSMQGINVFPKNDLSEVYIKSWQPNGTIQTIKFTKVDEINAFSSFSDKNIAEDNKIARIADLDGKNDILDRLTNIENELKQMSQVFKPKKGTKDEPNADT